MVASYVKRRHKNWDQWLPEFTFAINSAWQESTGYTPAEVALGRKLKVPLERMLSRNITPDHPSNSTMERQEALIKVVKNNIAKAQERQGRYYNARRRVVTYQANDLVWVRTFPKSRASLSFTAKLAPQWKGPSKATRVICELNYQVEFLGQPGVTTVHVSHLKPFWGDPTLS